MKTGKMLLTVLAFSMIMVSCGNRENGSTETEPSQSETINDQTPGTVEDTSEIDSGTMEEKEGWSDEMESLKSAVVEVMGENYWPNAKVSEQMLHGTFGITEDMYDDYMGEMPMITVNVDTLLIVKAKEGRAEDVEEAMNAYRDRLVNDTLQYPMNQGKIQASRIEAIGNYICFVQLGADVVDAGDQGEEFIIEQCMEQNELAIEVISNAINQL